MEPANAEVRTKIVISIASTKWTCNIWLTSDKAINAVSPVERSFMVGGYEWKI